MPRHQPEPKIRITAELAARLDALRSNGELSRDECARRLLTLALDHAEKRQRA